MQVPWDAINYYEFLLLRILTDEKNKHQVEEMEKKQRPGDVTHAR